MFLMDTLNMLNRNFGEIDLTGVENTEVRLSSLCAVFAQSEIV